jgi:hypothetical protein
MPIVQSRAVRGGVRCYRRLFIPRSTVITAWEFLRANGVHGREQLCFLAGRIVEDGVAPSAQVTSCVLPLTVSTAGYVTLSDHAQTAVVLDELERRCERPLVSLHTHADGGWGGCGPQHSAIDDHGVALTPEDGLFSGIVPYFALGSPFDFVRQTTLYERLDGVWVRLSSRSKAERVVVQDEMVRIVPVCPRSERSNGSAREGAPVRKRS